MKGTTLLEKRYGVGIRPGPVRSFAHPRAGCAAETTFGHPCDGGIAGSVEMWVDDRPPAVDWYSRLLAALPSRVWVRCSFCLAHLEEAMRRSMDEQVEDRGWAPGAHNPAILSRSPRLEGTSV